MITFEIKAKVVVTFSNLRMAICVSIMSPLQLIASDLRAHVTDNSSIFFNYAVIHLKIQL